METIWWFFHKLNKHWHQSKPINYFDTHVKMKKIFDFFFVCLFFFVHISQDHTWNYWAKFSQYIRQHLNICNIWKIKWSELPWHKTSQKLNLWGFFCSKCLVTQLKYCYLFQNILLKTSFSWTIWPTLLYLKVTNKYKFWPRVIT